MTIAFAARALEFKPFPNDFGDQLPTLASRFTALAATRLAGF